MKRGIWKPKLVWVIRTSPIAPERISSPSCLGMQAV
jgi:hypothetical protein